MDEIKKEQETEQAFSFRKSMGGFKKEDVIKFISEENRKFAEERNAMQTKLDEEVAKSEAAAKKSSELQLYYELLLKKRAEELAAKDDAIASASAGTEKAVADAVGAAKAEYEEKIAALNEKLSEAESREPVYDASKEEALGAELEAAKAEADSVKAELEAAKAELEAAKAELEAAKSENEALKAENEELKTKYEEALAAVPETDDEAVNQLKALNEELKAQNEELKAQFDALKEESENAVPNEEPEAPFENDTPVPAREFARQGGSSCRFQKAASPRGPEAPQKRLGAFDQRGDEVSDSISTLLEEIAYRCRLLAAYIKIGAEKDEVERKIDKDFNK